MIVFEMWQRGELMYILHALRIKKGSATNSLPRHLRTHLYLSFNDKLVEQTKTSVSNLAIRRTSHSA